MTRKDSSDGVSEERFSELNGELIQQLGDRLPSRRDFLEGTAKAGGGALALSLGTGAAAASGDGDSGKSDDEELTDVDILNYALTLEQLEATFYTQGLEAFSESDIENSTFAQQFGKDLRYSTHGFFAQIRDHEQAHVDALTTVIQKVGGEPVSGLEFEFPYESFDEFTALAQTFETLGVSAYLGVIAQIDEPTYVTAAGTITTIEARHSSYLNAGTGKSPFPGAFDEPKSMDEVLDAASQFVVSN